MKMMSLNLGPVYSRLAEDEDLKDLSTAKVPASYTLRQHQAQIWQAFSNSDVEIIFDTIYSPNTVQ
jgi:hypothetical protein